MAEEPVLYSDAVQALLEHTDVSTLLTIMRTNKNWRRVAQLNTIWREIINTKNLRDLVYHMYTEAVKRHYTLDPPNIIDVFILANFIWDILSRQGRPKLYSLNENVFVTFMFIWNAFPHVFVKQDGQIDFIQCTSIESEKELTRVLTPIATAIELEDDYLNMMSSKYIPEYINVLESHIEQLTPESLFVRELYVPYIHIDINDDGVPTIRDISDNFNISVLVYTKKHIYYTIMNKSITYVPRNQVMSVNVHVFLTIYNRRGEIMPEVEDGNDDKNIHFTDSDPSVGYIFVSRNNRADTLSTTGFMKSRQKIYTPWYRASAVYNHVNILGKEGRIQCSVCSQVSEQMFKCCDVVFCGKQCASTAGH